MSHFAGSYFPTGFGTRAKLAKTSLATPTASAIGSTEGTDQLTLAIGSASDLGAGLYNITVVIVQRTQSNAATSDVLSPVVSYVNEVGTRTQVALTVPTATTLDHKASAAGSEQAWTSMLRVSSGSIVVALKDTVTGAKSAGAVDWYTIIEKVASDL